MRRPTQILVLFRTCSVIGLLAFTLTACLSPLPIEPSPIASVEVPNTPTQSPSPTPLVNLSITQLDWIQSTSTLEWQLIGILTNREDFPVADIRVRVEGVEITEPTALHPHISSTVPTTIMPGGEGIFFFSTSEPEEITQQQISVTGQPVESAPDLDLDLNLLSERNRLEGGKTLIGEVINQGDHLLQLREVVLVTRGEDGELSGLAVSDHISPALAPDSNSFFQATYYGPEAEINSWTAFVSADLALLPSAPPLEITDTLTQLTSAQDQRFYLAEILNRGVTSWTSVILIEYYLEDDLLAMDTLRLPFAIAPREKIVFLIDPSSAVPAIHQDSEQAAKITPKLKVDPWKSLPTLVDRVNLPVSIEKYEQIGTRLYLEGTLTNPLAESIYQATAYIRILDTQGNTQSVSWITPIEELQQGENRRFDLSLILPEGLAINLVEYDLQGFAAMDRIDP